MYCLDWLDSSNNSLFFLPATLNGLLNNLGDENDVMRERTLKVLAMKLKSFDNGGTMKPEARDYIIQECKKILEVVDSFFIYWETNNYSC